MSTDAIEVGTVLETTRLVGAGRHRADAVPTGDAAPTAVPETRALLVDDPAHP